MKRALLAAAAFGLVLVPAGSATPPDLATGTLTLTSTSVTSSRSADGNTIVTGVNTFLTTGTFSGSATYAFRQVNHASGAFNSNGVVVCTCTVGGVAGTVVFRVEGTGALGPPIAFVGRAQIVDATGALEGLHGLVAFDQLGLTATYEGRVHMEP